MIDRLAGTAADWFASPAAIVLVIIGCVLWWRSRHDNSLLTLLLSILAISTTQLVLLDAKRSDVAVQAKLDRLLEAVHATSLIRAEDRATDEIERLRR